jgi:hypothetical protein
MSDLTPPEGLASQPADRQWLMPLLATQLQDLSEEEAQGALTALQGSPELRHWLRGQYQMEDLLSRALDPERDDFVNRVLHGRYRASSAQFVHRVTAAQKARRRRASWMPWIPVGVAAMLAISALCTVSWVMYGDNQSSAGRVLTGEVMVGQETDPVRDVPADSAFTVTGSEPAVIALGNGSNAVFSPDSHARLHARDGGSDSCELEAGRGDFHLDGKGQLNVGGAQVRGDDTQVVAEWLPPKPLAPPVAGAKPSAAGPTPGGRSLEVTVSFGQAQVNLPHLAELLTPAQAAAQARSPQAQVAHPAQVLHPHESVVIVMADRQRVISERKVLKGQVCEIAEQTADWALAIGDARSQRSCILPKDTKVLINGVAGDLSQVARGDQIEVQWTVDKPERLIQVLVRHVDAPPAAP